MSEPVFDLLNGDALSPLILLGEHAGRAFPPEYGSLGLTDAFFEAEPNAPFDRGTDGVLRYVAQKTGVTSVLGKYSRLLIDLNRLVESPGLIPDEAHGAFIPGNADLSDVEKAKRISLYYRPFHDAIEAQIQRRLQAGIAPILFSVHSYTPHVALAFAGETGARPPDLSIQFADENSLVAHMRAVAAEEASIFVRDNFPYDLGKVPPGSIHSHGINKGFECLSIEISIDRLKGADDEAFWGALLAKACSLSLTEAES